MKLTKINGKLYRLGQFFNRSLLKKYHFTLNDYMGAKKNVPHVILANHSSVMDYRITSFVLQEKPAYHVAAQNQFAGKKRLMFAVGALPKIQFVPDPALVLQLRQAIKEGKSVVIFAEGVISFDGTNRIVPLQIAKFIKFVGLPVAAINIKGTYLAKPRFAENKFRKTDMIEADFLPVLSAEEVAELSQQEIFDKVKQALSFDVWQWCAEKEIKTQGDRAVGLDNLLYQCMVCGGNTVARGNELTCEKCGRTWFVDEFYRLCNGAEKQTLHDWFENQRRRIRNALMQNAFEVSLPAEVKTLNGFNGFKPVGSGVYSQTAEGVRFDGTLNGKETHLFFDAAKHFAVPCGNDFIEFSRNGVCYRFYFRQKGAAIRCAAAVEESFKLKNKPSSE